MAGQDDQPAIPPYKFTSYKQTKSEMFAQIILLLFLSPTFCYVYRSAPWNYSIIWPVVLLSFRSYCNLTKYYSLEYLYSCKSYSDTIFPLLQQFEQHLYALMHIIHIYAHIHTMCTLSLAFSCSIDYWHQTESLSLSWSWLSAPAPAKQQAAMTREAKEEKQMID